MANPWSHPAGGWQCGLELEFRLPRLLGFDRDVR